MYYLMWRVLTGLHEEITISFLPVGHTKFSPDWCFGLLKRKYRREKIGCLDDIAKAVNESAIPNYAQLVGSQSGDVIVPMCNWSQYFEDNTIKTALKGITQMHHFYFKATHPGKVIVKNSINDTEKSINLVKSLSWSPSWSDVPEPIVPAGMTLERRWYLFDKIREYCPTEVQDRVCPMPLEPRP